MEHEIEVRLKAIGEQIETEKQLLHVMTLYRDCEMKTIVVNQCHGAIRGMKVTKEYLETLLETITRKPEPTIFDHGIDYRGGMTRG